MMDKAFSILRSVSPDLRYAVRQLRKSPGFAFTAVLTMALGIGANLAVFQLLYAVMFAYLPVMQPAQIYSIRALKSPFDGEWFLSYSTGVFATLVPAHRAASIDPMQALRSE